MAFLQALAIGLIALIILPGYFFYFDVVPKVAVLLAFTAVLLGMAMRRRDLAPGPRPLALLLAANAGSLALSTLFSSHRSLSLFGGAWRSFGLVAQAVAMLFAWLIARRVAGRPDCARTVLRGISIAGMLSAAYGIAQYLGWDPLLPPAMYRVGEGVLAIVRPPGSLGYASYFATWLLMSGFLSLELATREKDRVWRRVALAAAALSLAAMFTTGTRAAILGLVAGTGVWLWRGGFRVPRRAGVAALAVAIGAVCLYVSPIGQPLRSRSRWFQEDPWGGARPLLWRDSLLMAVKRPLAGYGPEVFLAEFPQFESKALAESYPDFIHESPHNMLLDAFVSQGLPGLAVLCALCVFGLAAAWRLKAGWLAAALAAGIVSQQFTAFTMPTALLFLVTVALAMGLESADIAPRRSALLAGVAPILMLALLYLTVRIVIADHALAETRRLLDARDLGGARAAYGKYDQWRLPGASADVWYSRTWLEVAHTAKDNTTAAQAVEMAGRAAIRGTRTTEEPFAAWYTLAEVAALGDDAKTTELSLRRAIAAHPTWFKPHWTLARQLLLESRLDEAQKEAALAAELDAGHHPEVAQTLQETRAK